MHSLHRLLPSIAAPGSAHSPLDAAAVTIAFAGLAWLLHGVTLSGALAGAFISFMLYANAGPGGFAALVSVFVITAGTTRIGYSRKLELGTAESRQGRNGLQILANLGVAAVAAVLFGISRNPIFLVAAAASLAEAAGDTASSEVGEAGSEQARLITTLELVPAGTNGGITILGTVAGALASLAVTGCCVVVKLIPASGFLVVSFAGWAGMLLDSVLGAALERRGLLNNETVNFFGTLSAALIGSLLTHVLA